MLIPLPTKQNLKTNYHKRMDHTEISNQTISERGNENFDVSARFLSYLHSERTDITTYEIAPTPLTGGIDSRIYQYKLEGKQPKVLRILPSTRDAKELFHLQTVYKTLSIHGINVPLIHSVCDDKSILGGCFAVMDLLPGSTLSAQEPEIQANVIGKTMANMHNLEVNPIIDELKESGIPEEHFLSPAVLKNQLNVFEENYPWTSEHIYWLRDRLPLAGGKLSIIHGDYHAGNLMFEDGLVTGVLDWNFLIADPAIDLAHVVNLCLLYAHHVIKGLTMDFLENYRAQVLKSYCKIMPVDNELIKAFRVLELLKVLCFSDKMPEQFQSAQAQRDFIDFIEGVTGLPLEFEHLTGKIKTLSQ
ncbi:phosphotransferase family protein [Synechococcus sp. MIT S9504]|uniref:phosphotransferase family protein n=2 Tax=Synechococcus sp. MIT S9504 TaxID=1801628 RepID=UPI001E48959B|nr:aminoglycoside phosphotransferase family protein [Synechococcus sp. MIT S9504]